MTEQSDIDQEIYQRKLESEDDISQKIYSETMERIHNDYYTHELVSETVPQHSIQWAYFREMCVSKMEGGKVNYEQIGRMFVEEAIEYVRSGVKKDI